MLADAQFVDCLQDLSFFTPDTVCYNEGKVTKSNASHSINLIMRTIDALA